jgi:hypothetical protein
MKSLGNPPAGCVLTAKIVLTLLGDKVNPNEDNDKFWKKA